MKIIYSRQHLSHEPDQIYDAGEHELISHYETPDRGEIIFRALINNNFSDICGPEDISLEELKVVHDPQLLDFYRRMDEQKALSLPDSFANMRNRHLPASLTGQLGYFCTDTQTPFRDGTLSAVLYAAGAALTGAKQLIEGSPLVYALTRPPGHHAGHSFYGGFCYANNAALAASSLSREGRTLLLDLDFHHGNGSQDIFYDTDAVYFVSLHGDPNLAYPYYSGYADETGSSKGLGFTRNLPLPLETKGKDYLNTLKQAIELAGRYKPQFLVISLGVDTFKEDPVGRFNLENDDFRSMGQLLQALQCPTLVIQEGGYDLETVGESVCEFLNGLKK